MALPRRRHRPDRAAAHSILPFLAQYCLAGLVTLVLFLNVRFFYTASSTTSTLSSQSLSTHEQKPDITTTTTTTTVGRAPQKLASSHGLLQHDTVIRSKIIQNSNINSSIGVNSNSSRNIPFSELVNEEEDADQIRGRSPTHHACDNYTGIYHIAMTDILGGMGTALQLVIGQLLYAEQYQLKPWVHWNNSSQVLYDPVIHGHGGVSLSAWTGRNATYIHNPLGHWRDVRPGPPDPHRPLQHELLHFPGTGVWEHYFEPVSDFVPGDLSCQEKLYVTMDLVLITPGRHGYDGAATRAWRYDYLPDYITRPHVPLTEWFQPQRQRAHTVIKKTIQFRPYLWRAARQVNPRCSTQQPCLGLHIRHSDKAAGRRQIAVAEFLPYAVSFLDAVDDPTNAFIYLATDSANVVQEIESTWPAAVQSRLRRLGDHDVVRSHNERAVFDITTSHHRTNQEALVEILALSLCQFLLHGLSAVSEASIWINLELHDRSVNLEDEECITNQEFGSLVKMVLHGVPKHHWPHPPVTDRWWEETDESESRLETMTHSACHGYNGVLQIAMVGKESSTGAAFFTHVVNQLMYADKYNLQPWVHLQSENLLIYDANAHNPHNKSKDFQMMNEMSITLIRSNVTGDDLEYPGPSVKASVQSTKKLFSVAGNGIWNSYFEPVSDFVAGDISCREKSLLIMTETLVTPILSSHCPWSARAWRYDTVPERLWQVPKYSLKQGMRPMRVAAHAVVQKYVRFRPHLLRRAEQVNPMTTPQQSCLAVHVRVGDKTGKYRKKVKTDQYLPYLEAFVEAGGECIYLATDSRRALQYIDKHFPEHLKRRIRTQGQRVVRTSKDTPTHIIDSHHRVNSETLVDILAMSKCQLLLHSFSTVSEAAIYLNLDLHNNSVNLEDPEKISLKEFKELARSILRTKLD